MTLLVSILPFILRFRNILLLIPFAVFALSLPGVAQDVNGISFGGPKNDKAFAIKKTTDNHILIAGSTFNSSGTKNVYLIKTDFSGKLVWERTIESLRAESSWAMEETEGGKNYMFVGYSEPYGQSSDEVLLLKVNASGDLLWKKNLPLPGPGSDRATNMIRLSDGHFILTGQIRDARGKKTNGLVVKIDRDGNIVWSNTYGTGKYEQLTHAAETGTGDILLTGISRKDSTADSKGWVLLLDKNGKQKMSSFLESMKNITPLGLVSLSPKSFVVTGSAQTDTVKNQRVIYLAMLDENGKQVWEKTSMETNKITYGITATRTSSGRIMIAGFTKPNEEANFSAVVYQYSSKGQLKWRKEYGGPDDMPYAITEIAKKKIAIAGQRIDRSTEDFNVWLLLIDDKGNLLK